VARRNPSDDQAPDGISSEKCRGAQTGVRRVSRFKALYGKAKGRALDGTSLPGFFQRALTNNFRVGLAESSPEFDARIRMTRTSSESCS
jgi:hypothetical protein